MMVKTQHTKNLYRNNDLIKKGVIISAKGNERIKGLSEKNTVISSTSRKSMSNVLMNQTNQSTHKIKVVVKNQNSNFYVDQEDKDMDKTLEFLDWYLNQK